MPQLQPTRVPQVSQSASFGLTECMKIMLGETPPLPDGELLPDGTDGSFPSLLTGSRIEDFANTYFYMDNIFNRFRTFEEGFQFLLHHFLPRIAWGMCKLSFKKLHLFCSKIIALGVEHRGGGISRIKHARSEKIKIWPTPKDNSDVRSFMASINIMKSWIKNFAEMAAPLNYLTGNVPFIWGPVQQASFCLLKDKCSSEVEKHGPLPNVPCQIYADASNWCMGCVVTQLQEQGTIKRKLEVPILYDSINLISSQRNYGTYKRELLAIVTFARKYDYLF
ncbi:hypothetical protein K3495_g4175 [Podosphaera aphanis]|nr:hypothetical protein K3495_g4175 [Podosphaera aphanis]